MFATKNLLRIARFVAAMVLAVAAAGSSLAQTAADTPPAPEQTNVPHDAPLDPKLPTIFIVGDSTARNKADLGWGDHFAHYFTTTAAVR